MKKTSLIISLLLQIVIAGNVSAQIDPHFSQYYAYPLWLNPALTGVFSGDSRVTANFKSQWASVDNAFQTAAISADTHINNRASIGINILDQQAGSIGYNYLAGYGTFGYGIPI